MKKKLIILIILLALISSMVFTSCTFIKENKERVSNAIITTVYYDYEGNQYFPKQKLSLTVTRSELISYINYILYLYNNYNMQYDVNEVFDSSIESLVTQKYQILNGMAYLMDNCTEERRKSMYYFTDEYKSFYGTEIMPEGLLTIAERYSSIASSNESFNSSVDGFVEEYYEELRELGITTVKENLMAKYNAGYSVAKENGVVISRLNEDGKTYSEGLYIDQLPSGEDIKLDYKKVFLKITLVKSGEDNAILYLPVGKDDIASIDDEENKSTNVHFTNKIASIDYEEPVKTTKTVKDEKTGKDKTEEVISYTTHTAKAEYKMFTPRTALAKEEEENKDETLNQFRYYVSFDLNDEKQKEFYEKGQIFEISPSNLDDAHKEAYRQFRESKKNAYIGFDEKDAQFNGLGYYYNSSFESAILTGVQYELKQRALEKDPVSNEDIDEQYAILARKQKEEYDILMSYKDRLDKFAELIATDLTKCYYIPLDALIALSYKYKDSEGIEHERNYATKNDDGSYTIDIFYITHILFKFDEDIKNVIERYVQDITEDAEKKSKKLDLILSVGLLNTNKSKEDYSEKGGDDVSDAYYVILDNEGNPILLNEEGKPLSVEDRLLSEKVKDVFIELENEISAAATDSEKLEIFKKYMVWYNDDGGKMSSDLGYIVGMGDIKHNYDGNDFPDTAKAIYIDLIQDGVINNYLGKAFTSYGLHIEMLSFLPFYKINLTDLGNGLWVMGADAKLDLKDSTFRQNLQKSIEDTINTNTYSDWTKSITKEEAAEHSTRNQKKINKLAKELGIKKS